MVSAAISIAMAGPIDWETNAAFVQEAEKLGVEYCWAAESWGYDAVTPLAVQPNYLGTQADRQALISGLRIIYALAKRPALAGLINREIRPGLGAASDAEILDFAQRTGHTCWHPTGTCRMGDDPAAVVDPDCRVRGVERLRVIDASVFPVIVSSDTNAPVLMLAEAMAERIRGGPPAPRTPDA